MLRFPLERSSLISSPMAIKAYDHAVRNTKRVIREGPAVIAKLHTLVNGPNYPSPIKASTVRRAAGPAPTSDERARSEARKRFSGAVNQMAMERKLFR